MDPLSEDPRSLSLLKLKDYVSGGFIANRLSLIRQRTHTGRPLGNAVLIQSLEKGVQRRLTLQKCGPHEKLVTHRRQGELTFDI
jgi:hypothetical protein